MILSKASLGMLTLFASLFMLGCSPEERQSIKIDGSSTVYPITEAVAEEFGAVSRDNARIRVTVGVSGTGGGFKKFCRGDIDITNASRVVKDKEVILCRESGIEYIEIPVAYDGIAILVNKQNDWLDGLTVAELKKIWEPEAQGKVKKWSDVRVNWPDKEIRLLGPGVDSGTFDYFTKVINGEEGSSRGDFMASEDDNVLVKGISGDKYALGFFGLAYYENNKDVLKLVAVDGGNGPIKASIEAVNNGTYVPLSRPIFIYVNKKSLERKEVVDFVDFYFANTATLSREVGYIDIPENILNVIKKRYKAGITGSAYSHSTPVGATLLEVYQ